MARLVCKKCQHDNLIDAPVWPSNQPLQDWFCKKCDEKLFSVSFKNPAHADTVPVRCQSCNNSTKIRFNPDDKSSTSASWPCGSCKKVIMQLDIQRERDTKISSPRGVNKSSHTAKQKNEIDSSEKFATFLNKNWKLIGLVAIVALVFQILRQVAIPKTLPRLFPHQKLRMFTVVQKLPSKSFISTLDQSVCVFRNI